jgi:hypothetical protein
VYVEELKYPIIEGVDHTAKELSLKPNGSLIFIAIHEGFCVCTIRATSDNVSTLEFNYKSYFPQSNQTELTKLVVAKSFRRTNLFANLLLEMYHFHLLNIGQYPFDNIVFNTNKKLLHRYRAFGHKLITNQIIVHPSFKNESYLMYGSKEHWRRVDRYLKGVIAKNLLVYLELAIKYWWYKNIALK